MHRQGQVRLREGLAWRFWGPLLRNAMGFGGGNLQRENHSKAEASWVLLVVLQQDTTGH